MIIYANIVVFKYIYPSKIQFF